MKLSIAQAIAFGQRLLAAQGVPDDIARDVAEHLVESDRVGYTSHGLSILPNYRRVLAEGFVKADGRARLLNDRGAMLAFDGDNGFGQHVGKAVMQQAIERARQYGQCIVTLRRTHHLGRMGYYGEMAAEAGLILLAFTNVVNRPPTVAPYGGAQACLTTNPLCFAGPLPGGRPPFLVDMATSSIAVNKARVLAARGEPAPDGALIDAQGNPTNDPNALFADPPGALLPFGGHKGYAMGLVAELLAGVLSGGGTIQPEHPRNGVATNNMFAILLDPQVDFNADWRTQEVGAFIDYLHACPPQPGVDRVQYPGEYEAMNRARHAEAIEFEGAIWDSLAKLAQDLGAADALPRA
ncbi:Ldh family oxidoreductase [Bordetella parapertussis]|uniref:L-lactate dehydrogenase n=7 Tax=Bordetella TaxID=517 RepID=A0A0H3LSR1_BORBR|nr:MULTISPECIES: Ldh family oxidoreductase [Bordetella]KAK66570.1 malate/L-lactate dehydrogenase [Bordetella bronchiseptica 980-2]KDD57232.1 malate/L-lactate dehydrogenase [Bordetella bronchiseptica OSU553]SHP59977.1 L-lactate dehydrogenase [Mycobacteroides abscessus subsp. abscessus]AMG90482.1 lactate dehydrogenase [Bordetella bronchiseptica]AOB40948.1 lactate dehydrogenase [Bordetella parapertussis]